MYWRKMSAAFKLQWILFSSKPHLLRANTRVNTLTGILTRGSGVGFRGGVRHALSQVKWTRSQPMWEHYCDVIMGAVAYEITSLTIAYSTVYSGADQRKHQSSASLAFVWGIHRGTVNSPHKWPVTLEMFPLDDVIMRMQHPKIKCGRASSLN